MWWLLRAVATWTYIILAMIYYGVRRLFGCDD